MQWWKYMEILNALNIKSMQQCRQMPSTYNVWSVNGHVQAMTTVLVCNWQNLKITNFGKNSRVDHCYNNVIVLSLHRTECNDC